MCRPSIVDWVLVRRVSPQPFRPVSLRSTAATNEWARETESERWASHDIRYRVGFSINSTLPSESTQSNPMRDRLRRRKRVHPLFLLSFLPVSNQSVVGMRTSDIRRSNGGTSFGLKGPHPLPGGCRRNVFEVFGCPRSHLTHHYKWSNLHGAGATAR